MDTARLNALIEHIKGLNAVCVAFSGGVDSTLLLKAAALSGIRTVAFTAKSETTPVKDLDMAVRMARELGIPHRVVSTPELENEDFLSNTPERCFHCKDIRYGMIKDAAFGEGIEHFIDGSNLDDMSDFRPGVDAARKHGVRSPLLECGFKKEDVRALSKSLGLITWDRPSSSCLATRLPYGTRITPEALMRIASAEGFLESLGFARLRVREHGGIARIEVPEDDAGEIIKKREAILGYLRGLGYDFVSLDLDGLRSGSMNRGARPPLTK